ncbi:MAG: orotidine-5'-phosphate decarboxylase [Flavobacteriaceae bacterium]|nr:orotidine-5'-phosphate decarboxylase [Flavobacteriaceae bacterium]
MTPAALRKQIRLKKSFLCVGLDTDVTKIPKHLLDLKDPIFEFNKQIIDATHPYAVAYKPNMAFYEAQGLKGWLSLQKTIDYLNNNYPAIFSIADAKRGDIGNTSSQYAKAFFDVLNFDALTIAPYMGRDSVEPFLAFKDKISILLALTSNAGGADFQNLKVGEEALYENVIKKALTYKNSDNLMFVVGATRPEYLKKIRTLIPNHFLLVPGVGAQGGTVANVCKNACNKNGDVLINSSRGIIYASSGTDFAEKAGEKAKALQSEMSKFIQ